ncbi:MAG: peptidylprolyl isomerase [Prevotella sp.]|uniref:peptidylprolyl isomerase n=1 Tax=Prevotella sp. TaxID=59823 RepID=UPI002A340E3C|nr:peptidylprolyl isomerase [Prevotella sp.]MDD7317818.1 peptidylprolyl isomerase [Prevotellaceae bacterium]MDY4020733.1 peptidylprolyl isomerase [Prevotella sp.]
MRISRKTALAAVGLLALSAGMTARSVASAGGSADNSMARDKAPADSVMVADDSQPINEQSVVDEVIWVVGDEAILKSDVEVMRLQAAMEGIELKGDPDCAIPELIAVQKLYLHQAAIDSIEVSESDIAQGVEQQINYLINAAGGREKLEEYRNQTLTQMRLQMHDDYRDRQMIERMKEKLVSNVTVTPADVRAYFKNMPQDSVPFVPTEVEVQIITRQPVIEQEELNRVKDLLRQYTERVRSGETTFATLARMYSEDPGSARQGGELDYAGRGTLDPAFAAVAFNLTDPNKISKIVETEFGFHIIQLIDKRGDKIKCRHILLKPKVSRAAIDDAIAKLDSTAAEIRSGKFTFDVAATYISDDKDTKNNHGLMANYSEYGRTSRFRMQDLPREVAKAVENMSVGDVSDAFQMVNERGKTVCAIVKLKSRIEGHRATITEDFQVMKDVVLSKRRDEFLKAWVKEKLRTTYVYMKDRYRNCDFEYEGWVK